MVFETEIKEGILRMNCLGSIFGFTLEDSDVVMARVIEKLIEEKKILGVVLAETREYEYDYNQTKMLLEIADTIMKALKEKKLVSIKNIATGACAKYLGTWYGWLRDLVTLQLRGDPIGAYLNLTREIRHLKTKSESSEEYAKCVNHYLENALFPLKEILEQCELIQKAIPFLVGYHIGDRKLYRKFFKPTIRPNFMYTKFMAQPPPGEPVAKYKVWDTDIEIFKSPEKIRYTYHVVPPEFKLSEEEYTLLDAARRIFEERRPKELEMAEQEKVRDLFYTLSLDLLRDLSEEMGKAFEVEQMEKLAGILTRYTAGLGILEILLRDDKIQDIFINSPMGNLPMFINHQDFEECETNLVPTREDGDRWATRFKLISGRPLDEANPVLDAEVTVPGGVARIAAINPRLSPDGLGFAIRRHRFRPWTFSLFLREKFMNSLFGALMWFLASYGRTYLVAGSRGAGKTSFLGSTMLQILPYYRILVSEDSVTGDCEILYKRNEKLERKKIGNLIDGLIKRYGSKRTIKGHEILDKNSENIKVFSVDSDGKIVLANVSAFIRHKVKKEIFEIRTRTGKKIKVTGDHSLFTLGNNCIKAIKCKNLIANDFLATPRLLFINNRPIERINLLDYLDDLKDIFIVGKPIKKIVSDNFRLVKSIAKKMNYSKSMPSRWKRTGVINGKVFAEIIKENKIETNNLYFKTAGNSSPLPVEICLDKDILTLIGLWLADGCYDKDAVLFSVTDEATRKIVRDIAERFNLKVRMHSDKFSLVICSSSLQVLMQKIFKLKGDAYTKRIPEWIFNLSKEQIASVLRGLYSGDGYIAEAEVGISLTSKDMIKDIQTLLLSFGIIGRINRMNPRDKTYSLRISSIKTLKPFSENIGFLQEKRNEHVKKLCEKISTHDVTDIIPLSLEFKKSIAQIYKGFNNHDYIIRNNNIGREKLNEMINKMHTDGGDVLEILNGLANSDIFWDQITDIKKEIIFDYVYDISVPINENFVCENIIAHNTLELPVEQLKNLGYNIQRLKSRSVITRVELELPAEEVVRTALRLGDSCLFIGEIRSSIRGNEEVVIVEEGLTKRIPIKNLENKSIENIYVPTLDKDFKVKLTKLTGFVKHPPRKKLLRITTVTGRSVTVTHDHSLFTTKDFDIIPIETSELKIGDKIVIPECMPLGYNDKDYLDATEILPDFRFVEFEKYLRKAISKLGWKKATLIANIKTGDIYNYFRKQKTNIPIRSFKELMKIAEIDYSLDKLKIKKGTSNTIPALIPVNTDFCRFLGYYISEGYTSKDGGVILSNTNKEIIEDIVSISENLFGTKPYIRKTRGWGESVQIRIQNVPLAHLISRLSCGRISKEKKIPPIIYGLSKEKICAFLKGLYSGDGSFTPSKSSYNAIKYSSKSIKLAEDVMYLLLSLGIVGRIYKKLDKRYNNWLYDVEFKIKTDIEKFLKEVGFVRKIPQMINVEVSRTKFNSVCFDPKILEQHVKLPRDYRHLRIWEHCSKYYLQKLATDGGEPSKELIKFANGEFFLDEIKEIEEIELEKPEPVYDLSVNPTENFIGGFGGILLHNTEAKALFEAMRIGAMANVVAGTIHGESAYGVFDRIVNDLGVPPTSFKATDLVIVCNKLKTPDGLKTFRRITEVTEVRKHWKTDPADEGGFVNLLEYHSTEDALKPTDTLLNGESNILNQIAERVPGWTGRWELVWDNIQLRAKILDTVVEIAKKVNNPDLLEAETTVKVNQMFHEFAEKCRKEIGIVDSKRVYEDWLNWFKTYAKAI